MVWRMIKKDTRLLRVVFS